MSDMEESAKEGMMSSIQTIEGHLGVGGFTSTAFGQITEGEEEDEEAPEEIELSTGVTLAVVNDEEIEDTDDKGKKKKSCCWNFLVVLAAFFSLPIVNVYLLILQLSIISMNNQWSRTVQVPPAPPTYPTFPTFPAHCETNPQSPDCQALFSMLMQGLTTPSPPPDCVSNPNLSCSSGRKKRSRSVCDLHPWMTVCHRVRKASERKGSGVVSYDQGGKSVKSLRLIDTKQRGQGHGHYEPKETNAKSASQREPQSEHSFIEHLQQKSSVQHDLEQQHRMTRKQTCNYNNNNDNNNDNARNPENTGKDQTNTQNARNTISPFDGDKNVTKRSLAFLVSSDKGKPFDAASKSLSSEWKQVTFKKSPNRMYNKHTYASRVLVKPVRVERAESSETVHNIFPGFSSKTNSKAISFETKGKRSEWTTRRLNYSNTKSDGYDSARSGNQWKINLENDWKNTSEQKFDSANYWNTKMDRNTKPARELNSNKESSTSRKLNNTSNKRSTRNVTDSSIKPTYTSVTKPATVQGIQLSNSWNIKQAFVSVSKPGTDRSVESTNDRTTEPTENSIHNPSHFAQELYLGVDYPSDHSQGAGRYRRSVTTTQDYSTINFQHIGNTLTATNHYQLVEDTYTIVYGLFGFISGLMITAFNYRVTALVGGGLSGVSCLVAAFLPLHERRALAFMLGALPGIGNNFIVTSVTVALLEYFRERRLRVISITDAASELSVVLFILVQTLLFPELGVSLDDWRQMVIYQAITYVLCLAGAAALIPLNLQLKDSPGDSVRSRILDIPHSGLQMLKSPLLYAMGAIFLFTSLGGGLPNNYVESASGVFIFSKLLVIFIAVGAFLGSLVSCCLPRKKLTLIVSVILIAIYGILMGCLTLTVSLMDDFKYAISYTLLFGLFAGLRTPLLTNIIPLVLEEEHLGLAVGMTSFSSGLGSIIGDESAAAIMENHNRVDAVFYLSGLALLASSGACVLLLMLVSKVTRSSSVSSETPTGEEEEAESSGQGAELGQRQNNDSLFTISTDGQDRPTRHIAFSDEGSSHPTT